MKSLETVAMKNLDILQTYYIDYLFNVIIKYNFFMYQCYLLV